MANIQHPNTSTSAERLYRARLCHPLEPLSASSLFPGFLPSIGGLSGYFQHPLLRGNCRLHIAPTEKGRGVEPSCCAGEGTPLFRDSTCPHPLGPPSGGNWGRSVVLATSTEPWLDQRPDISLVRFAVNGSQIGASSTEPRRSRPCQLWPMTPLCGPSAEHPLEDPQNGRADGLWVGGRRAPQKARSGGHVGASWVPRPLLFPIVFPCFSSSLPSPFFCLSVSASC